MYSSKDMRFEDRVYGISLGDLIGVELVNHMLEEMIDSGLSKESALQELRLSNFGF